ncbi:hypothetical protein [Streptomyces catenulae]|uniref:Uncharacterized protein n=1 Tax=Streptomyces catenulae TaxID=66875 RepID=A0ABV2YS27_9ACTN|nr:hypothetical protein [Streptomyces catenulae]
MKFPAVPTPVTVLLAAGAAVAAAVALSTLGLFGGSWDVTMEVTGTGSADVTYSFSGDNDGTTETGRTLPWSRVQNVGYGFNDIGVRNPAPGAVCRIYVDGRVEDEQKRPDAKGVLSCSVHLQQD